MEDGWGANIEQVTIALWAAIRKIINTTKYYFTLELKIADKLINFEYLIFTFDSFPKIIPISAG